MARLVFEVVQEADGGYCAECLTENMFTEGDTWENLRANVLDATAAFFFDRCPSESAFVPGARITRPKRRLTTGAQDAIPMPLSFPEFGDSRWIALPARSAA